MKKIVPILLALFIAPALHAVVATGENAPINNDANGAPSTDASDNQDGATTPADANDNQDSATVPTDGNDNQDNQSQTPPTDGNNNTDNSSDQ